MYGQVLLIYVVAVNLVAFALMGRDKSKAKKGEWRISEKTLFLAALLGGSVGAMAGMKLFHHKTKHWLFRIGMPVIFLIQFALAVIGLYWYYFVR